MSIRASGGKIGQQERSIYNEKRHAVGLQNLGEMILGLAGFNGHVGKWINLFEGAHGGNEIG